MVKLRKISRNNPQILLKKVLLFIPSLTVLTYVATDKHSTLSFISTYYRTTESQNLGIKEWANQPDLTFLQQGPHFLTTGTLLFYKRVYKYCKCMYHIYTKYSGWLALANSVDPDQNVASDQGLHCFLKIWQFLDILPDSKIDLFKF